MAGKRSKHVRRFLSAGAVRREEAEYLRTADRTLGAVYLAGYTVECVLKALVLALFAEHEQPKVLAEFRGGKAHDYDWLKSFYRKNGGAGFPKAVVEAFVIVSEWGIEFRYNPRKDYPGDADEFFRAVDEIAQWADARI